MVARTLLDELLAQVPAFDGGIRWPKASRIRNLKEVESRFDQRGRDMLREIGQRAGPEVEIRLETPPPVAGEKPGYGLTCRMLCGAKPTDPVRIYIDVERIAKAGPERVTANEVLAHEGSHEKRGEVGDPDSPVPEEGESYLDSVQMRRNEGVITGPKWLEAHPEAGGRNATKTHLWNETLKVIRERGL